MKIKIYAQIHEKPKTLERIRARQEAIRRREVWEQMIRHNDQLIAQLGAWFETQSADNRSQEFLQ